MKEIVREALPAYNCRRVLLARRSLDKIETALRHLANEGVAAVPESFDLLEGKVTIIFRTEDYVEDWLKYHRPDGSVRPSDDHLRSDTSGDQGR